MKTTVVCGLLGSGKTTFIRNQVKFAKAKTVVLVNDFGAAGIDGEVISTDGIETIELPSGCVCCTLKFDLITTLQKVIRDHAPENLVIEPSGVASPAGVIEALDSAGVKSSTIVGIVDVREFLELYESGMYGSFFEEQIALSDVILLNKMDLASTEAVAAVEARVSSINSRAVLFYAEHAAIRQELPNQGNRDRPTRNAHVHFDFRTETLRLRQEPELDALEMWMRSLAAGRYGAVARAKALVQTSSGPYRFDIVYGKLDRAAFAHTIEDSRVVVIGSDLDRAKMEQEVPGG